MSTNREQLEMMLVESLDAGVAMPREVREWVAADADAAAMLKQYKQLGGLLKGWRVLPANIDFKNHAAQISVAIQEEHGARSLTELVPHWSGPVPDVDYAALKNRISSAVAREAAGASRRDVQRAAVQRRRVFTWMGRIAAPLAVAAAIALAIWWPRGTPTPQGTDIAQGPKDKQHPMVVVELQTPEQKASAKVKIKFDEAGGKPKDDAKGDSGMAITGSEEEEQTSDDDAFLY